MKYRVFDSLEAIDRVKNSLKKFRQRELDKAYQQSQSYSHSK